MDEHGTSRTRHHRIGVVPHDDCPPVRATARNAVEVLVRGGTPRLVDHGVVVGARGVGDPARARPHLCVGQSGAGSGRVAEGREERERTGGCGAVALGADHFRPGPTDPGAERARDAAPAAVDSLIHRDERCGGPSPRRRDDDELLCIADQLSSDVSRMGLAARRVDRRGVHHCGQNCGEQGDQQHATSESNHPSTVPRRPTSRIRRA